MFWIGLCLGACIGLIVAAFCVMAHDDNNLKNS